MGDPNLDRLENENDELRRALSRLSGAAYDVVQRNRQIYMGGVKYSSPTIKKLAEAMYEANKLFREPAQHKTAEANVIVDDLGSLLLGTVRYCTRGNGYTVEYVAKLLRRYFPVVAGYEQRAIMTEIDVALAVPRDTIPPSDREAWSALVEEIRPPKAPFTVDYHCHKCKARDVKLWRGFHGCADKDDHELLCASCLAPTKVVDEEGFVPDRHAGARGTDQVEGWLPAVPVDDTFWGYTSVPTADMRWWRALATYPAQRQSPDTEGT